jgi:hypothetical protein
MRRPEAAFAAKRAKRCLLLRRLPAWRNRTLCFGPPGLFDVQLLDVEFSGSKPTPAAAIEAVKATAHGAARPEHLSA